MTDPLRILVVETAFRAGHDSLTHNLLQSGFEVLGPACSERQALDFAITGNPALALVELSEEEHEARLRMVQVLREQGGVESLLAVHQVAPETTSRASTSSALGFVPRDAEPHLLQAAITLATRRQCQNRPLTHCTRHAVTQLHGLGVDHMQLDSDGNLTLGTRMKTTEARRQDMLARLSPREREVLRCAVDGLNPNEIATKLYISPYTARNHLHAIFRKLSVHSQLELVRDWWATDQSSRA